MNTTDRFMQAVLQTPFKTPPEKLIVVTHLVSGVDDFLLAVNHIVPIAAVIPKPNSIDQKVLESIRQEIPLLRYTRSDIKLNPACFIRELHRHLGTSTFAVVDMGGYFSRILEEMKTFFGARMLGVVEDTENGHQKYHKLLSSNGGSQLLPTPVISVARSGLKDPEDLLVGQSIVFSAEALLRERGELLLGRRALIFGFGKIGKSIAQNLYSKRALVDVIDTNSCRQVFALAHGYQTGIKQDLLRQADLIFCATGNRSLRTADIADIKHGAYVFTATSADDEIEAPASLIRDETDDGDGKISVIKNGKARFFLCNNGNSVNFVHGGVVGSYIKLIQGELIYAASQFSRFTQRDRISELDEASKRFISDLWLQHFWPRKP